MKNKFLPYLVLCLTLLFLGCGGSSSPQNLKDLKTSVNGVVQKGPFLKGSVAKIFKLDSNYQRTFSYQETTVSDNEGSYHFADISWSGLSEIEVSGLFLDENTNVTTKSATITSIVMVKEDGTVNTNINLLTHMANGQIKKRLKEGKSFEEAHNEVVHDVFNILGRTDVGIDDFGDLDLADLLGSNATANSELLFLSAALLKSDDYMGDLEALLLLYKTGGIDAILGSDIYARLMQNRQALDETTIVKNINSQATEAQIADIAIAPIAQITRVVMSEVINLRLYGTKFTSKTPNITLHTTGGTVTAGEIIIADNNTSATIAISGDIEGCKDVSVHAILADMQNVPDTLRSNALNMRASTSICSDPDNDGIATIQLETNKPPVAIIGMFDNSEDGQQSPKSISTRVGTVVSGLETSHSYDQDPYPTGGITYCEWKDENEATIKSTHNNACGIYDKVFESSGEYTYTLTVTDNREATNSNTVTIHVADIDPDDTPPTATINEQNSTVSQTIYSGNAPYITAGGSDDNGIVYCKWQNAGGTILYENSMSTPMTYLDYNECLFEFPLFNNAGLFNYTLTVRDGNGQEDSNDLNITVLENHIPTATIGTNRDIVIGTTLELTAVVTHNDDDDDMTYQWMYGVKDSTTMLGGGNTLEFSHQFDTSDLYLVTFRVGDRHNASSLVAIDVNVTEAAIPTDSVVTGSVMWEDTVHSRSSTVDSWDEALNYCKDLRLGGFDNWRISTAQELRSIMSGIDGNNTQSTILETFSQIFPNENVTSWTSDKVGENAYIVGWFTGGDNNLDGLGAMESGIGVRCARELN